MSNIPRILFVDDEDSIRLTLSALLQSKGFDITTAATVNEALALMMQYKFDVLIADLNIGTAGDGFTVISAMRSAQPDALRLILTGYPDFESAVKAIQEQVHEYITKPADIEDLVAKIRTWLLQKPLVSSTAERKRLSQIIRENRQSITTDWLRLTNSDADMKAIVLTEAERRNNLEDVLDLVVAIAEGQTLTAVHLGSAAEHGRFRQKQGYSIPLLIREGRYLNDAVVGCVQKNILSIDLSTFVGDLRRVFGAAELLLEEAARSFLQRSELSERPVSSAVSKAMKKTK